MCLSVSCSFSSLSPWSALPLAVAHQHRVFTVNIARLRRARFSAIPSCGLPAGCLVCGACLRRCVSCGLAVVVLHWRLASPPAGLEFAFPAPHRAEADQQRLLVEARCRTGGLTGACVCPSWSRFLPLARLFDLAHPPPSLLLPSVVPLVLPPASSPSLLPSARPLSSWWSLCA